MKYSWLSAAMLAAFVGVGTGGARAATIRVMCYSDANECPVTRTLAERFMQANPDAEVIVDEVPYQAILISLPARGERVE